MVRLVIVLFFGFWFSWKFKSFGDINKKNKILFCVLEWYADNSRSINPQLLNYINNGGDLPSELSFTFCSNVYWKMPKLLEDGDERYWQIVKEYKQTQMILKKEWNLMYFFMIVVGVFIYFLDDILGFFNQSAAIFF